MPTPARIQIFRWIFLSTGRARVLALRVRLTGRFLFLFALPGLAAADAAAFELPALTVFDDDIIGREQMALLAGGGLVLIAGPSKR